MIGTLFIVFVVMLVSIITSLFYDAVPVPGVGGFRGLSEASRAGCPLLSLSAISRLPATGN